MKHKIVIQIKEFLELQTPGDLSGAAKICIVDLEDEVEFTIHKLQQS